MKNDLTEEEVWSLIQSKKSLVLFGYAPMCGTCQISNRMLKIVSETQHFSYYNIDLNYHKRLIETYQISSAPALLLFKEGQLVERMYAFKSVVHLSEKMKNFILTE